MTSGDIERFRTAIQPFRDDWRSVEIRYVAASFRGLWINAGIVVTLCHEKPEFGRKPTLPRIEGLKVGYSILSSDSFDRFLDGATGGEIEIDGIRVVCRRWDHEKGFTTPYHLSFSTLYRETTRRLLGAEFPTFSLQGYEGSLLNTVFADNRHEEIDAALQCLDEPWDGLGELMVRFLGEHREPLGYAGDTWYGSRWDQAFVKILAPVCAMFSSDSKLSAKGLALGVRLHPLLTASQVSLGAVVHYPEGSSVRRTHRIRRKDKSGTAIWRMASDALSPPSRASAFLRYRRQLLERLELWGPGIGLGRRRVAAHALYDEDLALLRRMLLGELNGKRFEEGVAWLLHLLGLSVVHYGGQDRDAPDLLAFWNSPSRAFIVECTLREINVKNKLAKLKARQTLLEGVAGGRFHPILFTAFPEYTISRSELLEAGREDISVVSAGESLQDLLDLLERDADPDDLVEYFRSKIPFSEDGRGLSWF